MFSIDIKRFLEPAFSNKNWRVSYLIVKTSIAWLALTLCPWPNNFIYFEQHIAEAEAEARFRDAAMQRMRQVCFTEKEIHDLWFTQELLRRPDKLLIIVKGREALCGGRGLCGCKAKKKIKGSV